MGLGFRVFFGLVLFRGGHGYQVLGPLGTLPPPSEICNNIINPEPPKPLN